MDNEMRTIIVVYSNSDVDVKSTTLKKYSFNTTSKVKVGKMYKASAYDTNIVVVKILDDCYKYFNYSTGELTNEFNSTRLGEIKTLKIVDNDDVITASKVKK